MCIFFKTRVREIKFMRKPIHTMYLELKIYFFINLQHEKSKESLLILFKVIFLKKSKIDTPSEIYITERNT